jgi:hypothetical protein
MKLQRHAIDKLRVDRRLFYSWAMFNFAKADDERCVPQAARQVRTRERNCDKSQQQTSFP